LNPCRVVILGKVTDLVVGAILEHVEAILAIQF